MDSIMKLHEATKNDMIFFLNYFKLHVCTYNIHLLGFLKL